MNSGRRDINVTFWIDFKKQQQQIFIYMPTYQHYTFTYLHMYYKFQIAIFESNQFKKNDDTTIYPS